MAASIQFMVIVTALLVNTEFKSVESFKVNRASSDSFDNPYCDSTTCPTICSKYDAECIDDYQCTECVCGKRFSTTFVGDGRNGGRCLTSDEVVKDSVPEASFRLSGREIWFSGSKCLRANPELNADSSCTDDIYSRWIWTVHGQLMNLKRLDCMDRGRPGRVVVAACDPTNDAQKWRCNATIHPLNSSKELGFNTDNQVVLDDYGATWDNADTFCKKMIEYKGCYRFNDGETMRDVFENSFNSDCTTNCALTFKTTGPVDVQNSQCSLLWKNSTFMGDDPQWLPVSGENEGFSLAYDQQYGGVELKVTRDEYLKWNGTILKLEVECRSQSTREQHCILMKFYSVNIHHRITPDPGSGALQSVGLGFQWLLSLLACYLFQMILG